MAAAIGIAKTATEIFLGVGEISIDNFTFKLFYKWSVTLFIVSSVLVSTSQFFGEPIQCETVRTSSTWYPQSIDERQDPGIGEPDSVHLLLPTVHYIREAVVTWYG